MIFRVYVYLPEGKSSDFGCFQAAFSLCSFQVESNISSITMVLCWTPPFLRSAIPDPPNLGVMLQKFSDQRCICALESCLILCGQSQQPNAVRNFTKPKIPKLGIVSIVYHNPCPLGQLEYYMVYRFHRYKLSSPAQSWLLDAVSWSAGAYPFAGMVDVPE